MSFTGHKLGLSDDLLEASRKVVENSAEYKKFFDSALKKFGVTSPAELDDAKKKEFFDYIDKNYNSDDEKGKDGVKEETVDEVSMSAMIQKAIDIASSMGGNMTGAVKRIEAIKKGLSKNKNVAKALQLANESIEEKLDMKGKTTIDADFMGSDAFKKKVEKKYRVKIKTTSNTSADISGDKKNIIALLKSDVFLMDADEIEDVFSELSE
jgi:hypothetical protein